MKTLAEIRRDAPGRLSILAEGEDGFACMLGQPDTRRPSLRCIASWGGGWDHVSVSLPTRCPMWPEMEAVKRLFFRRDETAMQLHVPPAEHVDCHPHRLHLWRPQHAEIPRPPAIFV